MNKTIEFLLGITWATTLVLALQFTGRLAWILLS